MTTCRTFSGSGETLEEAANKAEAACNEVIKGLASSEVVAMSTNWIRDPSGGDYPQYWHTFVITVVYQKADTSVSKQLESIAKHLTRKQR